MFDTYDEELNNLTNAYLCEMDCNRPPVPDRLPDCVVRAGTGKGKLPRAPYILRNRGRRREIVRARGIVTVQEKIDDLPDCPGENFPTIQHNNLIQRIKYFIAAFYKTLKGKFLI